MSKDKEKFIRGMLIPALILVLVVFGICALKAISSRTAEELGPITSDLHGLKKWQILYRCAGELDEMTLPANLSDGSHSFSIPYQATAVEVAEKLEEAGLISDAGLFLDYLVYSGMDSRLQPGNYVLSAALSIPQITKRLTANEGKLFTFAFLPGMRLEEIAELVDAAGFSFSGDDFLALARNYPTEKHPTGGTSLEGYLLPGSYEMNRDITLENFLGGFVGVFRQQISPLQMSFAAHGLSVPEAVTLASMITREAMSEEEYPLVASVFYNRIGAGMKLASDPTAQYALGYEEGSGWWKSPMTTEDVSVDSPYNTYLSDGLPPTPICSPSAEALKAVADPADTDYYYFRVRCDGTPYHSFAVTFEEHQANACD